MINRNKPIPGQSIRNTWKINPRTRIHDNDLRKNKKKERQLAQKEIRNLLKRAPKGAVPKDINPRATPFDLDILKTSFTSYLFIQRSNSRLPISFRKKIPSKLKQRISRYAPSIASRMLLPKWTRFNTRPPAVTTSPLKLNLVPA